MDLAEGTRMLRLIQVGVGGFGESWTDVVEKSKYAKAEAYVDINEEALKMASKAHKMPKKRCFTSLDIALEKVEADAVLAVVPPAVHAEVAIKALKAGLHALTEKPIADTIENAKKVVTEAEKRNLKLMVSQNYRFRKGPRTIRKLLETEKVGKPSYAVINFHKAPRFIGFRLKMEHPLLVDMSIHHFDMIRYIFNADAESLYCRTWRPSWSWFEGDPSASAIIKMENGLQLTYFGSWVSLGWETTWDGDWRIECSNGGIHWDENVWVSLGEPRTIYEESMVPMPFEGRDYSLYEFAEAIKQNRQPETNGRDNLKSLAMVIAALDSAKRNREVAIRRYL
jgi:predicted dehydrogenase